MDYKLLADTALLAGEILLCSGAETYRVEDTMYHILKTSDSDSVEAMALMTGIVVTVRDVTTMKRVNDRTINISNIIKVNDISRRYCNGKITLEETYELLKAAKAKQYNRFYYNLATIGMVAGFAVMFGGQLMDVLAAALAGALLAGVITLGKITRLHSILVYVISGIVIALFAFGLQAFLISDITTEIVIVSSIMPIVPGVAITNAIRDILQGDYLSGCARILEALLVAAAIAVGAGLGMAMFYAVAGGGVL